MALKKVLYVHHGKGLGGAPLSLLYLIEGLDKTKYKPIVLFLHDSEVLDLYRSKDIEIIGPVNRYDFPHTKIWWLRWYHVRACARVVLDTLITRFSSAPYWLQKIKPDIIHLNTSSLIAWALAARKKNIPIVWHVREPLADGYLGVRKAFVKICVKRYASAITPICKNDARPWCDSPKTHVIYNVASQKKFDQSIAGDMFLAQHGLDSHAPKILFLGGLSQEKGTLVILRAFKQVLKKIPEAQLLIAGYFGNKRDVHTHEHARKFSQETIERMARTLKNFFPASKYYARVMHELHELENLGNNVVLLGPINNVPEAMSASSVIVFPATVGHFARPVVEAGFMSKPVVTSCLPPLDELVLDGKTGFLVDPNNINLWAEKLCLLLQNYELRATMGKFAYNFCSKKFSLQEQSKKIDGIYTRVIAQKERVCASKNRVKET